jgi:glyceraldehyde 3-phosphate dehydrogenase
MPVRLAVNGFGRIGRLLVRFAYERDDVEVVAINSRADSKTLAHLLKYDSVHGTFNADIDYTKDSLKVDGKEIRVCRVTDDITKLPWKELGVDIALESTGRMRERSLCQGHIDAGAKKAIIAAPGKGEIDATFVIGVNHEDYDPDKHMIISNASCTTNCLAPVVKVLHDNFTVLNGMMNTVHAYTMDQRLLDGSHDDLRRARAAALSIVPTSTGAARNISLVIPDMKGRLDGMALRVPTADVSLLYFVVGLKEKFTAADINNAMKEASEGYLKGILHYNDIPLVSVDFVSSKYSSIFDANFTEPFGDNMAQVLSWYDNEAGFTARLLDLSAYIASKGL